MTSIPRMMIFHVPEDSEVLRALATVSIRHSHLDHVLRMMIKTLSNLTLEDALRRTSFKGSAYMRKLVAKLACSCLGRDSPVVVLLDALLKKCRSLTQKRNAFTHNVWAKDLDSDVQLMSTEQGWASAPTIIELDALAAEIEVLVIEMNNFRLRGPLAVALNERFQRS